MPGKRVLTFEEFVWQTLWLECGRLSQHVSFYYTHKKVRQLIRKAKRNDPLFDGPYGDRSEWAGMCRNWYRHYLAEMFEPKEAHRA